MPQNDETVLEHIEYHKDGSIRARGTVVDGQPAGYWEWLRKGGTIMRSGHFDRGQPTGEWVTYGKEGSVYKVTDRIP